MKKFFSGAVKLFVAVSLLLCCLELPVGATGYSTEKGVLAEFYGRGILWSLSNGEALVNAYDAIVQGIDETKKDIKISTSGLTMDEFQIVLDVYRRDHAEQFWLSNTYTYSTKNGKVVTYSPKYLMTGNDLKSARERFDREINKILSLVSPSMSDFEKELYIHDTLARRIVYKSGGANAHNSYGAIVEGKAVCEGYAEAFQYLMQLCGIQSFLAMGSSLSPTMGSLVGHEWNYFKLDGSFYHVDLTWNDQEDELYHAYFNMSDKDVSKDHTINLVDYPLPKCNSSDLRYSLLKGNVISGSFSSDMVGDVMRANGNRGEFFVDGSMNYFISWLTSDNVIRDIATRAGIRGGFAYGYSILGDEIHFYFETENGQTSSDKAEPPPDSDGQTEADTEAPVTDVSDTDTYPDGSTGGADPNLEGLNRLNGNGKGTKTVIVTVAVVLITASAVAAFIVAANKARY